MRVVGTVVGAIAFCLYSRTWKDAWHVVYDVPAALAVYSFLAQMLAEGLARQVNRWWWARLVAVAVMSIVTIGREFESWPISGHVTCLMTVGLVQLADGRLPRALRLAYLLPLPLIVAVRLFVFDVGFAAPLWTAIIIGIVLGACTSAARP